MLTEKRSLGSYAVELCQMHCDDMTDLHQLSLAVRWPHRADDWRELLKMGQGFCARDSMGRLICSMMYFSMDEQFASIGMGISSPRLQSLGAGHWLAEHVQAQLIDRKLFLIATKDSLPLCLSFGFTTVQAVFHYNGLVKTPLVPPSTLQLTSVQHAKSSDHTAIALLDSESLGFNRDRVIHHLLTISSTNIICEGGIIKGFALCRKFGRGHVIGPVIAETEEQAAALIQSFLLNLTGQFVRIDSYQGKGVLSECLSNFGLNIHETATKMTRGTFPSPVTNTRCFALASQALG